MILERLRASSNANSGVNVSWYKCCVKLKLKKVFAERDQPFRYHRQWTFGIFTAKGRKKCCCELFFFIKLQSSTLIILE